MKNLDLENFKLYKSKFTNHHNRRKGYRVINNISYKSYLGLMCPFCYEFKIIKINHSNYIAIDNSCIEDEDIQTIDAIYNLKLWHKCSNCKREIESIQIDPNLTKAISIFNKKGYFTEFCCEGHGDINPYILFRDHTIDKYLYKLPITWYDDLADRKTYFGNALYTLRTCIRSDKCNYKEAMLDILEFASSLPYNNKLTILF